MKKISIVIPAHYEEGNIFLVHQRVKKVFSELQNYHFEIIFVNDGSRDKNQEKIEDRRKKIFKQRKEILIEIRK